MFFHRTWVVRAGPITMEALRLGFTTLVLGEDKQLYMWMWSLWASTCEHLTHGLSWLECTKFAHRFADSMNIGMEEWDTLFIVHSSHLEMWHKDQFQNLQESSMCCCSACPHPWGPNQIVAISWSIQDTFQERFSLLKDQTQTFVMLSQKYFFSSSVCLFSPFGKHRFLLGTF